MLSKSAVTEVSEGLAGCVLEIAWEAAEERVVADGWDWVWLMYRAPTVWVWVWVWAGDGDEAVGTWGSG